MNATAAFLLRVAFALTILGVTSIAHPVAQGALELRVSDPAIVATLRVSNEQIFVAGSLGEGATEASSFEQLLEQHGDYLLRHFSIRADGTELAGKVVGIEPPRDRSAGGFTTYRLQYPARGVRELEVRQSFLTEILFAPGNPWEAPIISRVSQGNRFIVEGALLTAKQPLRVSVPASITAEFQNPAPASARLAWDFFRQGLHHIAAGWDHALFVAALVVALSGFWRVVAIVSAFTLAHTVTLTLAALGWIHLRSSVVEPLIAVSIVVAAALSILWPDTPLLRPRVAVAFGFGLLHGLGFAGGLVAAMQGFTPSAVGASIGGFSIGVELGHQVLVLPLLGVMAALRSWAPRQVAGTTRGAALVICAAGLWLLGVVL